MSKVNKVMRYIATLLGRPSSPHPERDGASTLREGPFWPDPHRAGDELVGDLDPDDVYRCPEREGASAVRDGPSSPYAPRDRASTVRDGPSSPYAPRDRASTVRDGPSSPYAPRDRASTVRGRCSWHDNKVEYPTERDAQRFVEWTQRQHAAGKWTGTPMDHAYKCPVPIVNHWHVSSKPRRLW
jgi:hypothetical protein